MRIYRWLYPGLGIKRWLLLFTLGVMLFSIGLAIALNARVLGGLEDSLRRLVYLATGRFWPAAAGGTVMAGLGLLAGIVAVHRVVRTALGVLLPRGSNGLAEIIYQRRLQERGPRVVAIGGGTGLATLLRGLKEYTSNITAIVTVTDDGGSSGRLRGQLGVLPPGDIRNCLVALADTEPLMEKLFQHRFDQGEGLAGHSFGNLFIAAMFQVTGDFEAAVRASSQVLAVRGRVLPSTLSQVVLGAELADGTRVFGETSISTAGQPIRRIFLEPHGARPLEAALQAIYEADAIILGPGSLYTSILPNLLVDGVADAIRNSPALKIYVCNVMTQPGETDGYSAADHVRAITNHVDGLLDLVVVNTGEITAPLLEKYRVQNAYPVATDLEAIRRMGLEVVGADLVSRTNLVRHDPRALARLLLDLIARRRPGPRGLLELYLGVR